jgi:hypothetical protein
MGIEDKIAVPRLGGKTSDGRKERLAFPEK